jgi:hypothetical protein
MGKAMHCLLHCLLVFTKASIEASQPNYRQRHFMLCIHACFLLLLDVRQRPGLWLRTFASGQPRALPWRPAAISANGQYAPFQLAYS